MGRAEGGERGKQNNGSVTSMCRGSEAGEGDAPKDRKVPGGAGLEHKHDGRQCGTDDKAGLYETLWTTHKFVPRATGNVLVKVTIKRYALKRPGWQETGTSTAGRPEQTWADSLSCYY